MLIERNLENGFISEEELDFLCREALRKKNFKNQRLLVIIPDSTRTAPVGLFFRAICGELQGVVKKLDFIIALGTHPPMDEERIRRHLQISEEEKNTKFKKVGIFNHQWDVSYSLAYMGTISSEEIEKISGGLMSGDVPVYINKKILDYDELFIVGPVFPHEVVGFSGGYKYLFPGIAGPEIINKFHWLGALITNPRINGVKDTPVREIINRATSFIKIPITLFCLVMRGDRVCGFYAGGEKAWEKACDLSSRVNIKYVDRTFHFVIAKAPLMYEDLWTAGKCMYKLEPVVEDGGTLIIYAPHVREVSYTHGEQIEKVGYHTRDYFLKQMEKFKDVPGAILAHCTHVKGIGVFHQGKEIPRINVILATGISKERCQKINLGYIDPENICIEDYMGREKEGILVVEQAGEILYRLSSGKVPDIDELYKKFSFDL